MTHTPVVTVMVKRLAGAEDLPLPEKATTFSSGFDLRACLAEQMTLAPGDRTAVPTGIAIALPQGFEAQVRPRSGLALKRGLAVLNGPGTIDADYRGEIKVILANLGAEQVLIKRGDRIAQIVVQKVPEVVMKEVESLPETIRGAGGFGHTGTE